MVSCDLLAHAFVLACGRIATHVGVKMWLSACMLDEVGGRRLGGPLLGVRTVAGLRRCHLSKCRT